MQRRSMESIVLGRRVHVPPSVWSSRSSCESPSSICSAAAKHFPGRTLLNIEQSLRYRHCESKATNEREQAGGTYQVNERDG
jgi:hypothetical protein